MIYSMRYLIIWPLNNTVKYIYQVFLTKQMKITGAECSGIAMHTDQLMFEMFCFSHMLLMLQWMVNYYWWNFKVTSRERNTRHKQLKLVSGRKKSRNAGVQEKFNCMTLFSVMWDGVHLKQIYAVLIVCSIPLTPGMIPHPITDTLSWWRIPIS